MTPWTTFYDHVLPFVPGAGTDLVDFALRGAVTDFCEDSEIDQQDLPAIDLVTTTNTYPLAPPTNQYDVVNIMSIWCNDHWLTPKTLDDLVNEHGTYWPTDTATTPRHYSQLTQDTFLVYPIPTIAVAGALKIRAALRPDPAASGTTDWLATRYRRDLAAGAIAELMMQPAKPWSNPQGATTYMNRFVGAKSDALADRIRSFTRGSLQVNFPRGY